MLMGQAHISSTVNSAKSSSSIWSSAYVFTATAAVDLEGDLASVKAIACHNSTMVFDEIRAKNTSDGR
ncbi:hypothetical protein SBOR_10062 [Sclerotinia borealis F-4128]|uniref:Uncharacterized protein n=1 Tax=Sclerotinia borealis (strain F-4128) TaxID=1432307 RepID=W9C4Q6_SCLBF|nr:hypothetical protein SBOR_10062 [Sclerotinia borealis F-4128]